MAFDFPNSPTNGQQYTPAGGPTYTWDSAGTKWTVTGTGISGLSTASIVDVMTGTSTSAAVTPDALAGLWEKGTALASAATLVIPNTGGGLFHVTGTTGITDIDFATAKDGRSVWLIFDAALTLTHSANLVLPGGANITTVPNDRALFVQENADVVYCLHFQRTYQAPPVLGVPSFAGIDLSGTVPTITFTDTDNGADAAISGNSGSMILAVDTGNETGGAAFIKFNNQNVTYYTLAAGISSFQRNAVGSTIATGTVLQVQRDDTTPAVNMYLIQFANNTVEIGGIKMGTGGTQTAYVTTSDMRMKDAASRRTIDDSGQIIDDLHPVYFRWPGEPETEDFGFFAQEVVDVPQVAHTVFQGDRLVDKLPGEEGFVPWTMEHGRLEAILVAELQHLRKRVALLEGEKPVTASRKK